MLVDWAELEQSFWHACSSPDESIGRAGARRGLLQAPLDAEGGPLGPMAHARQQPQLQVGDLPPDRRVPRATHEQAEMTTGRRRGAADGRHPSRAPSLGQDVLHGSAKELAQAASRLVAEDGEEGPRPRQNWRSPDRLGRAPEISRGPVFPPRLSPLPPRVTPARIRLLLVLTWRADT